jgi:hypothetical protein
MQESHKKQKSDADPLKKKCKKVQKITPKSNRPNIFAHSIKESKTPFFCSIFVANLFRRSFFATFYPDFAVLIPVSYF